MSRAYLRIDPDLYERKMLRQGYPAGAFAAYLGCICLAESQPSRGRFRDRRVLGVLLGPLSRWIPWLIGHGDLVEQDTYPRLYVDGWDEWQEGDVTVRDRMARLRGRKAVTPATVTQGTPWRVTPVTVPVTVDRRARVARGRSAEAVGGKPKAVSGGGAPSRAPRPPAAVAKGGQAPQQGELATYAVLGLGTTPTARQVSMLRNIADQERTSRADVASGWAVIRRWVDDARNRGASDLLAVVRKAAAAARRARAEAPPAGGRRRPAKVRPDMAAAARTLAADLAANGAPGKPSVDRATAIDQLRQVRGKVNEPAWSQLLARYGLTESDLEGVGG